MNDRTCIITRNSGSKEHMIRFVLDYEGNVVPDIKANLPGRGVWITGEKTFIDKALKTKAFNRSFKKEVVAREDLASFTEKLLRRSALGNLAIARKAGKLVAGTSKIIQAIASWEIAMILHACSAAADSKRKIAQTLYTQEQMHQETVPICSIFTQEELSVAFGDKFVIHCALLKSSIADSFMKKLQKLEIYCGTPIIGIA